MGSSTPSSKVIVFGKVGAGKSTLSNMLFAREPNPNGGFEASDSIESVTKRVQWREGNGWYVVDTIGMGEANLHHQTTTENAQFEDKDTLAKKALTRFLKETRNEYMYIIYVVAKGRVTDETALYWDAFKDIFKGGESNFVVVYTKTDQEWFQESRGVIEELFKECGRFITVDFPPLPRAPKDDKDNQYWSGEDSDDDREGLSEQEKREKRRDRILKRHEKLKKKHQRIWAESLERLEKTLRGYSFRPVKTETYSMDDRKIDQRADSILSRLKDKVQAIIYRTVTLAGSGINIAAKAAKILWSIFNPF